jgi:hypothetical protein
MIERTTGNTIAAVALGVTVLGGIVGGAYKVGYDVGAKDYETLVDFKAKLPPMMEQLTKVARDLNDRQALVDENKSLKARADKLSSNNKQLQEKIKSQNGELEAEKRQAAELKGQLDRLVPASETKITVTKGVANRVIPNQLTMAVDDFNPTSVRARINGHSSTMYPGDHTFEDADEYRCNIELQTFSDPTAEFIVACAKRQYR